MTSRRCVLVDKKLRNRLLDCHHGVLGPLFILQSLQLGLGLGSPNLIGIVPIGIGLRDPLRFLPVAGAGFDIELLEWLPVLGELAQRACRIVNGDWESPCRWEPYLKLFSGMADRRLAVMPILCQYPLTVRKSLKRMARNQHIRLLMEGVRRALQYHSEVGLIIRDLNGREVPAGTSWLAAQKLIHGFRVQAWDRNSDE